MFRRISSIFLFLCLVGSALAQTTYLGIFVQGTKIGYAASSSSDDNLGGKPLKKYTSKTVMNLGLLGAPVTSVIDQISWTDLNGRPTLTKFSMTSAGRSNKVEANFLEKEVRLAIDNNGSLTTKTVLIPTDAPIVDDAINAMLEKGAAAGKSTTFYVLDPTTATFIKNTATLIGPAKTTLNGKQVDAIKATIAEYRMTTTLYLSAKGDLIKAEAVAGMEMRPVSEKEALADVDVGATPDLAELTKIKVEPALGTSSDYASAKYLFDSGDFSRAPIDPSQSIRKEGNAWIVFVKPIQPNSSIALTIEQAAAQKPEWISGGLNIPSDDETIRSEALKVLDGEKNAVKAARKIGAFVQGSMNPNAGIGVLRDAREVFKTKEGVCRDYAILTASLLRSAKIPARLASGLVYDSGAFYYHAWVESWDGANWYGIDSTRKNLDVTPGHIKLAQGSVEDAFLFTFLDRAKVRLLEKTRKGTGS